MTKDILIKKGNAIHNGKYDYSLVLDNFKTKEKLPIICSEHGIFYKTFEKHIGNKQGCPECSGKKRYTTEYFISKAKTLDHAKDYDYSKTSYVNNKTHIIVTCKEHGDFKITPGHLLSGEGCPKCRYIKSASSIRRSIEEVIKLAKEVHGNKYDYSLIKDYKNDRIKYPIICPLHGTFEQTFNNHIRGKQGCPVCGIFKYSKEHILTNEEFIEKGNKVHNFKYDYSKINYINSKLKVKIICPIHGEFEQIARNHLQGAGCPSCYKEKSNVEKELYEFIKELLPEYEVIENDRTILDGQEIDVLVPNLNIGFEMNGLIWHSEKFNDDKYYHINKTKKCLEKNIKLYHIFEDEWMYNKDICMSRIKHIFHKNIETIFARKCKIKKVETKEQRSFLDENHLQGYVQSKIAYGLYYDNKLISLMTFGKKRVALGSKATENEYELLRFCSKQNYNIPGAAQKLLKQFIKDYNPNEIISYADRRWSFGNLYEKIGFIKESETKPNYFYVIGKTRKNRFSFRKDQLIKKYNCPKDISEHDFCLSKDWYRIYDCGTLKYIWKKEN